MSVAILCMVAATLSGAAAHRSPGASATFKMLAATAYLIFAVQVGALQTTYGHWVLAGLVASWFGDLLLIPDGNDKAFVAGLASFLAAHLLYAVAFVQRQPSPITGSIAAVVLLIVATIVLRWLTDAGLQGRMRDAVIAYLAAITAMVALGVATGSAIVAAGAIAFAVSDILVARERFVTRSVWNRRVGQPLYFLAQLLLGLSIAAG
jgi:uncharacterized membrane protein YhhN